MKLINNLVAVKSGMLSLAVRTRKFMSARSVVTVLGLGSVLALSGCHLAGGVLHPKGFVAQQERELIFDSIALMLIVVIPVIIMSFAFAFRYRASHKSSEYKPNWGHSNLLEAICWGIPCAIIIVLGILTWKKTHQLDPYRKLNVPGKPLLIQAVSLQWKWLFIYPNQHIATVNYVAIPKGRQVEFWITSDAPMSAFFIPQLGSQIYSMAGMRTRLHLVSSIDGIYQGLNSQFNGDGFSEMRFNAQVMETSQFNKWVAHVQQANSNLDIPAYQQLVKPSIADSVRYYSDVRPKLFERIMDQYNKPNMRLH